MKVLSEALLKAVSWLRREEGQTMVEYGIILALISVAAIAVLVLLGPEITGTFQDVVDAFP